MKATLFLFILLVCQQVFSQQAVETITPSLKYGKPSQEELSMTVYAPDTTAAAVVLYSKCDVGYELIDNSFCTRYDYAFKIKVLKPEGTSYANISIPFYSNERNGTLKEAVRQVEAFAYNLENGKMVRTKMGRDLVFSERMNPQYMQVKFSIPAVKEGTVIEYKYQLNSELYYQIDPWKAQWDIPVLYAEYEVIIPEYFKFGVDMRGYHTLSSKEESVTQSFVVKLQGGQTETLTSNSRKLIFTGKNMIAVRPDKYVWYPDDYLSSVNLELQGVAFPFEPYRSFTHTWEDIDKMLLDDEDFGALLKMRNPYRDEMASLSLDRLPDRQAQIIALYTFLKKKVTWNEQYRLYGSEVKKAVKAGTGSNADINFLLMSMLRDAGIPCWPVVMSRRSLGILPYSHPSIQKLNTMVVAIADTDTTQVFLDGSMTDGLNNLPAVLLVDRARRIKPAADRTPMDPWIDLTHIMDNQIRSTVQAQVQADGLITGNHMSAYGGQYATSYRKRYHEAKDEEDFINQLETHGGVRITDFELRGMEDFSPRLAETYTFEKQASLNGDLIYLNPMIFLHISKCPFTQAERQLPLELPYTERWTQLATLTIPDGYVVDELPQPLSLRTEDRAGTLRYHISQTGQTLSVTYLFSYNKLLHPAADYPGLKSFWEAVAEKNNEMLVLKKQ